MVFQMCHGKGVPECNLVPFLQIDMNESTQVKVIYWGGVLFLVSLNKFLAPSNCLQLTWQHFRNGLALSPFQS